jgi:pyruvate/2-oxoglutarate dehydrogenase complex dihydrolipoamide acyltransferase (E2) component
VRRLELSETRRILLWLYDEPSNDPYISLTFEVVIEPALRLRDAFEREHGERIGLQHIVTKAVARTIALVPEINVKIIRRRIYRLDRVHLCVPVHLGSGADRADETGMMILHGVDRMSLLEIARATRRGADDERQGRASLSGSAVSRRLTRGLPDGVVYRALDLVGSIARKPWVHGLTDDRLAVSSAVTNVGSIVGLPKGARFVAASHPVPSKATHVASIFGIGPIQDGVVVEDGAVVARKVLPIVMIADHRAIDGVLMGRTAVKLAEALLDAPSLGA